MFMRKLVAFAIIVCLVVINGLEFHDLLEPKTLPEILTGIVSVPIIILMAADLLRNGGSPSRDPH
jgi:hypothetical protein